MSENARRKRLEKRTKKYIDEFSNYENAVTFISSLEAWFEHRWGVKGKIRAGLLDKFNRFPNVDGLTPDFEVRFHTPYVLWGEHKRIIQQANSGRDAAADQIVKYAMWRPRHSGLATSEGEPDEAQVEPVMPRRDVLVLVRAENDDVAAEALKAAREREINVRRRNREDPPEFAPIVVLGYYRDPESSGEREWYVVKWRGHHNNCRFSTPNIISIEIPDDLNALLVDANHHVIPVDKMAIGLSGRVPFVNDHPPAIYTAMRLVLPAINATLSDDERDELQTKGKIVKSVRRVDLVESEIVREISPQPRGIGKWMDEALDFLVTELKCGRKVPDPGAAERTEYFINIDNTLVGGELREVLARRAARRGTWSTKKGRGRRRVGGDAPGQMKLFADKA